MANKVMAMMAPSTTRHSRAMEDITRIIRRKARVMGSSSLTTSMGSRIAHILPRIRAHILRQRMILTNNISSKAMVVPLKASTIKATTTTAATLLTHLRNNTKGIRTRTSNNNSSSMATVSSKAMVTTNSKDTASKLAMAAHRSMASLVDQVVLPMASAV